MTLQASLFSLLQLSLFSSLQPLLSIQFTATPFSPQFSQSSCSKSALAPFLYLHPTSFSPDPLSLGRSWYVSHCCYSFFAVTDAASTPSSYCYSDSIQLLLLRLRPATTTSSLLSRICTCSLRSSSTATLLLLTQICTCPTIVALPDLSLADIYFIYELKFLRDDLSDF